MTGSCHTAWAITTDALENEALGLNTFTMCFESLTAMMAQIMALFTHLPFICDWLEMPASHDLLKSARQHNYGRISGCFQQLSVWKVKITPRSLTAGSLSALNYAKLVLHIPLPEQTPECCGTCLTCSKQCSLNWLGMIYLELASICLKHNAQNMKTNCVSDSFKMHCGNSF